MSTVVVVWLVVGLVSTALGVAVLIALIRHVLVLIRALGRFGDEVGPISREIAAETQRARHRSRRIATEGPLGRS